MRAPLPFLRSPAPIPRPTRSETAPAPRRAACARIRAHADPRRAAPHGPILPRAILRPPTVSILPTSIRAPVRARMPANRPVCARPYVNDP
jgi:hypothetical protein